jgi:hypothetical protein
MSEPASAGLSGDPAGCEDLLGAIMTAIRACQAAEAEFLAAPPGDRSPAEMYRLCAHAVDELLGQLHQAAGQFRPGAAADAAARLLAAPAAAPGRRDRHGLAAVPALRGGA